MDGSATGAIAGHDKSGRFVAGHTEYAAKKQRIAERVVALAQDYDAKSQTARMLLRIAAEFIDTAERTRSHAIRARSTRAAGKVLDRIPKRPEPAPPTIAEWERRQREAEK